MQFYANVTIRLYQQGKWESSLSYGRSFRSPSRAKAVDRMMEHAKGTTVYTEFSGRPTWKIMVGVDLLSQAQFEVLRRTGTLPK